MAEPSEPMTVARLAEIQGRVFQGGPTNVVNGVGPFDAADMLREIERLRALVEKLYDPTVQDRRVPPERIWVQWVARIRSPLVYDNPPAIVHGALGCYDLAPGGSARALL